jgi:hypothetical protein
MDTKVTILACVFDSRFLGVLGVLCGEASGTDIPGGWAFDKPRVAKIHLQAASSCDRIRRMLVAWIAASIGVVGVVAYRARRRKSPLSDLGVISEQWIAQHRGGERSSVVVSRS